jgi:1-acyl-sn-glycerol-3-phosphate acyltransferase
MEISARSLSRLGIVLGTASEYIIRYGGRRVLGPLERTERARWLHRCCAAGLRRLNIPVRVQGNFPQRGLIVSNHLSYLDILVYSSVAPCVFVSKREVRSWPVFGLMATLAGTVFVDRSRNVDALRVNNEMLEALAQNAVVVLYAEGTSSNGSSVLPFRPALFEGVVKSGMPITPAHISYQLEDGDPGNDVCYWGDHSFLPHLLRLLSRRGVRARVGFSSQSHTFDDRKVAAQQTNDAVRQLALQAAD